GSPSSAESSAWSSKLRRANRSSELPRHQSSARKPPDLPDAAPPTTCRSMTIGRPPCRLVKYAIAAPIAPPPQITMGLPEPHRKLSTPPSTYPQLALQVSRYSIPL